jgi:tellurite resistance protein TerC
MFQDFQLQDLWVGLPVIASLVLIEGLLSVDNVLGIAALARPLTPELQKKAIRLGMAGAYGFRVVALLLVSVLIQNTWVRWAGAGYLIWLMCSHLSQNPHADEDGDGTADAKQVPFASVLAQIALMDLSLSIDNVIAAVALAPKDHNGAVMMWPIYLGVLIAILALQAIAPHAVHLLKRFPIMEPVAFILIGFVGCILIYEEAMKVLYNADVHIAPAQKFVGILGIIGLALLYQGKPWARALFKPLFAIAVPLMKAFDAVVSLVFWPAKKVLHLAVGSKA